MGMADDRDGFTEAERRAIDKIRRELDAEFGPLERATPGDEMPSAREEPPPREAPPPHHEPVADVEPPPPRVDTPPPRGDGPSGRPARWWRDEPRPPRVEPPLREYVPRDAEAESSWQRTPSRPAVAYGPITGGVVRPSRRRSSRGIFLVGALIGGIAGGIAGGTTAVVWQSYVDDVPPSSRRAVERPTTDSPSAATSERLAEAGTVQTALNTWLDAMRRGDVDRQMDFYPARVPVYYTSRDVARAAVRDEKLKAIGSATRVQITTDTPAVELVDDGRRAITRFRKRYVIEGPALKRKGEVVQEVRWARTADGWRIVSERDAEVLAR